MLGLGIPHGRSEKTVRRGRIVKKIFKSFFRFGRIVADRNKMGLRKANDVFIFNVITLKKSKLEKYFIFDVLTEFACRYFK